MIQVECLRTVRMFGGDVRFLISAEFAADLSIHDIAVHVQSPAHRMDVPRFVAIPVDVDADSEEMSELLSMARKERSRLMMEHGPEVPPLASGDSDWAANEEYEDEDAMG